MKENFACRPSGSVNNAFPENFLEIKKFLSFFFENFISFLFLVNSKISLKKEISLKV